MNAASFKNALLEAKPSVEVLVSVGFGSDETREFLSSFDVHERTSAEYSDLPDPVLRDLFSCFNVSSVEVGMVRLNDFPEQVPAGWVIGEVEADFLVLDNSTFEISVRDISSLDHVIWKCARDGSSFLAALAESARFLSSCISIDQIGTPAQFNALKRCESLAGGEMYLPFYKMLLGVEQ